MLAGFLGCCFGFGYIVVVVVHSAPVLFYRAPQARARLPDFYCAKPP